MSIRDLFPYGALLFFTFGMLWCTASPCAAKKGCCCLLDKKPGEGTDEKEWDWSGGIGGKCHSQKKNRKGNCLAASECPEKQSALKKLL